MTLDLLHHKLRNLAQLSSDYRPEFGSPRTTHTPTLMSGYSCSKISLAVHKETDPPELAQAQADYMKFLGDGVCPKIYAVGENYYCMEWLYAPVVSPYTICAIETFLGNFVWSRRSKILNLPEDYWRIPLQGIGVEVPDWALDSIATIHGDPTIDNLLMTKQGFLRIIDPIPPLWLKKPSILAVDHGKILQSYLGWEHVFRGVPLVDYYLPTFMHQKESARRAVFWAMVAFKRLVHRGYDKRITAWATKIAGELGELCEL